MGAALGVAIVKSTGAAVRKVNGAANEAAMEKAIEAAVGGSSGRPDSENQK